MGQRRKHVLQTAFNQDMQPPADNQQIVRAVGARGGNIIEVEYPNGSMTLCMMPAKFNRKLWVRRGGFLIIEPSPEAAEDASSRVTGTICAVLYDEHIKQLKKMPGVWPVEFANTTQAAAAAAASAADDFLPTSDSEDVECQSADEQQIDSSPEGLHSSTQQQQQQQQQQILTIQLDPAEAGAAATQAAAGVRNLGIRDSSSQHQGEHLDGSSSEEDDGLPPLQQINNRRVVLYEVSDDSESDDE